jgi:hypothetical protein
MESSPEAGATTWPRLQKVEMPLASTFALSGTAHKIRFGTMTSKRSMESFHGALALNEIANKMLKLDSCEYGIATLKDAIGLMKSSFAHELAFSAYSTAIRPDVECNLITVLDQVRYSRKHMLSTICAWSALGLHLASAA